jgi:5'-nucleotidase
MWRQLKCAVIRRLAMPPVSEPMRFRVLTGFLLCVVLPRSWAADPSTIPWPPPTNVVSWRAGGPRLAHTLHLQVIGINDFHGNLQPPEMGLERPVGGARALVAYLKSAERAAPDSTLFVHAGDQLGASPPSTRLLHNEPGIQLLNLLANDHCVYGRATEAIAPGDWREHPNRCNVVGTLGNHEFDAGIDEIRRLLNGGNAVDGPFLENPYRGARVLYVCANVRDRRTGKSLLPPYTVVSAGGVPVGVIGALLRGTPSIVPAWAVRDVEFLDEADSINEAAAQLEAQGVHTLIVIIHQGLTPTPGEQGISYRGPLTDIVARLDPDIDVVVSGHTHRFTNTLLPARDGTPILVTQAYSYGIAFSQIDLQIDRRTRDVIAKSARIVPVWADVPPGTPGDEDARRLEQSAQSIVQAKVSRVVATLPQALTRATSDAGESTLGDLVADSQRAATHADIALMNPGGLRSDLHTGSLTWGDVLTLQPFGNHLVTLDMTGAQLLGVLEEEWPQDKRLLPRILKTSGLRFSWDAAAGTGAHVHHACDDNGMPIDPARRYRVTVNDFMAGGGDDLHLLATLPPGELGPLDADAFSRYLELEHDVVLPPLGRLSRSDLNEAEVCSAR